MADNLTTEMLEELKYAVKPTKDSIKQADKILITLLLEQQLDRAIEEQDEIFANLSLYRSKAKTIATKIKTLCSKLQRTKYGRVCRARRNNK